MKKIFVFTCVVALVAYVFVLLGCADKSKIKIGVIQIVEHESLDSARQGFIDELQRLGYRDGENVSLDLQVAGGEISNCVSISQKFLNDRKDIVLAISTPCTLAMANATRDIPILATAITDFEGLGVIKSLDNPGTNVTGVSDLAPIDKIIELVPKLDPKVKKIGVLYSMTDPSPVYQAHLAERKIKDMGFECELVAVSQVQDVQQAAERLVNDVDALYTPVDKITSASMPQISQIFYDHHKFVVCAEERMISQGAISTYGVDYYELGKMVARQAVDILEKKKDIKDIQIECMKNAKLSLNYELIKKLGLTVSDDLKEEMQ